MLQFSQTNQLPQLLRLHPSAALVLQFSQRNDLPKLLSEQSSNETSTTCLPFHTSAFLVLQFVKGLPKPQTQDRQASMTGDERCDALTVLILAKELPKCLFTLFVLVPVSALTWCP